MFLVYMSAAVAAGQPGRLRTADILVGVEDAYNDAAAAYLVLGRNGDGRRGLLVGAPACRGGAGPSAAPLMLGTVL